MPSNKKLLQAAAGNAGESLYVEDVFSTYLYEGTGAAKTITNGIDLAGEGGLVWVKNRTSAASHILAREPSRSMYSDLTDAESTYTGFVSAYNSDGFSLGDSSNVNGTSADYASWTFRKAEKFFDVVTYTGDGVSGRTVAHNLGVAPAVMLIKRTSASGDDWAVYHSSLGATKLLALNQTNAQVTNPWLTDTAPTDSVFTLNNYGFINASGSSYVAYLFASDAGGFGDDGSENIIKCGSYTGTGAAGNEVNLGFEPQWILVKGATSGAAYDWYLVDNMRGITTGGNDPLLWPNKSDAEDTASNIISVTATGFKLEGTGFGFNRSGETYIYIAIRRPMKTPESGTEVFAVDKGQDAASGSTPSFISGFPVDLGITNVTIGAGSNSNVASRLLGTKYLSTSSTIAESTNSTYVFDYMTGWRDSTAAYADIVSWMFKRATGFFDVVAYTGTNGTISRNHNLTVAPELMIFKRRDGTGAWTVLSELDGSSYSEMALNSTIDKSTRNYSANQYLTAQPTATVFAQAAGYDNVSGADYITYLFATLAGVSKVGSYTGTGADLNVDCGFSAGARFILIKRTDSTGDWYVWDSVRGITAGNDPYILLNTTAAEVTNTDYIDPLSSGFTVTSTASSTVNVSSSTYIFLAIA